MMTPTEKELIEKFNAHIDGNDVQITFNKTAHEQSARIEEFCEAFSKLAPCVKIKTERPDDDEHPSIVVRDRLRYRAVPSDRELAPFLEALKLHGGADGGRRVEMEKKLSGLSMAASVEIFISPVCPFCPLAVNTLAPMPLVSDLIRVSVVDASMFPELAAARGVRSVPATFLDESFSWTGAVDFDEIVGIMKNRDPSLLGEESLKNMLHEGMARKVAEMMEKQGDVFPAFVKLLFHEKWPVRLGAMVAAEELSAMNRDVARKLEAPVWEKFGEAREAVKGDLLYVIGEAGGEDSVSRISEVLGGDFGEEVKEAAREAAEAIRARIDAGAP